MLTAMSSVSRPDVTSDRRLPLYHQVRETLAREILELSPGDRLPTETELMHRFGVSRTTVREAVAEFVHAGVIEKRAGKGTFIRDNPIEQELSRLTGFVEDMKALRLVATAKVVTAKEVAAPPRAAEQLAVPVRSEVMLIERVRLADDRPVSFDVTYLPLHLGRSIIHDDLTVHPIFTLLEEKYGVPLSQADYRIEAGNASRRVAHQLDIAPQAAILKIERTTYASSGEAVDYEVLHYRGDRVRYRIRLQR